MLDINSFPLPILFPELIPSIPRCARAAAPGSSRTSQQGVEIMKAEAEPTGQLQRSHGSGLCGNGCVTTQGHRSCSP